MPLNILIVDDAENTRGILSFLLRNKGYEVTLAVNGEEALRAIEAKPPDLIVLDAMMPKVSGYEVCARVKGDERTRSVPVLLLTAQSQQADETVQGWKAELRPNEVVAKPFKINELLVRIESLLKSTRTA